MHDPTGGGGLGFSARALGDGDEGVNVGGRVGTAVLQLDTYLAMACEYMVCNHGLYRYGLYSYGLYRHGSCRYGLN